MAESCESDWKPFCIAFDVTLIWQNFREKWNKRETESNIGNFDFVIIFSLTQNTLKQVFLQIDD